MKRITTVLLLWVAAWPAKAQLKLFEKPESPAFHKAVQLIIGDFPYNFRRITGNLVSKQGHVEHYASLIALPDAESCLIGRYHSELDTTDSWQALMLTTEEFSVAAKKYKSLYQQLKTCKLKTTDGSLFYMKGNYEAPSEEMDFVTSTLIIETPDIRFREFKIELELLYELDKWIIHINMSSKKRDDEMKPDWMP
jgi:hypothetical protein